MRYEYYTMGDGTIITIPVEHDPEDLMSGYVEAEVCSLSDWHYYPQARERK